MTKKIKVYIDAKPLSSGHAVRGVGSYTRSLIDSLKSNEEIELVEEVGKSDIIHYPYFDLFFATLPFKKQKPTVVTIHDVVPLIYPEYYKPGIRGKIKFQLQKHSLKNVAGIITDSETSKKDIVRLLDVPQEKVFPIHLGAGENFKLITSHQSLITVQKKYKLPSSFVLYVGDVNYNKNIPILLKAFKTLITNYKLPITVVLVGDAFNNKDLPEMKSIFQLIENLNIGKRVLMPGFVLPEDLVKIYNLATVYCQPSLYEGFGLPVLEAMACGCPVVAAKTQALVEMGGEACFFVDPYDPKSIAQGLNKVISNEETKKSLIEKGLSHAKKFSWVKTAQETIYVYRRLLNA